MHRALALVILALAVPSSLASQPLTILRIRVTLIDADRKPAPVPRHALLISDNPSSAPPRRVVTGLDGTTEVKLRPGNYTVESDAPVTLGGKVYQWVQTLDIAGAEAVLELTADNADVEAASTALTTTGARPEADTAMSLAQWQDSVVALWTPTTHASGFVIDSSGLIATNQRVVGTATSIEVQFSPTMKVAAQVLAADAERDVAVLRVDAKTIAAVRPVPLGCPQPSAPAIASGQELFTIGVPLRQSKSMASGTVTLVDSKEIVTDFMFGRGSAGGPVFAAGGELVGLSSLLDGGDDRDVRGDSRVVSVRAACEVLAAATARMAAAPAPSATPLPVEPERPYPLDALKKAIEGRAGSLNPYQVSSEGFDVGFVTPLMIFGAQYQSEQASRRRTTSKDTRRPDFEPPFMRPQMDFSNWSPYVADFPPVLMIRATPRLVEGFWTTVGRAAARTQGVALPPIKRFKSGFSRLRAFCGETEVTPIHPFKLERRTSETEAIYEGLYVFDPGALTPQCGTVKLVLYSEKEPDKPDTKIVDAAIIQQVWDDFAGYRSK